MPFKKNTADKKLGVPSNPPENVLKIKDNNTNNNNKTHDLCLLNFLYHDEIHPSSPKQFLGSDSDWSFH